MWCCWIAPGHKPASAQAARRRARNIGPHDSLKPMTGLDPPDSAYAADVGATIFAINGQPTKRSLELASDCGRITGHSSVMNKVRFADDPPRGSSVLELQFSDQLQKPNKCRALI
jgi:hypothetical protein